MPGVQKPHWRPCSSQKPVAPNAGFLCWRALNGHDVASVALDGEDSARFHRESIEGHRAGAAERGLAAAVGTGEEQGVAQEMDEKEPGLDFRGVLGTVDGNGDGPFHAYCIPFGIPIRRATVAGKWSKL